MSECFHNALLFYFLDCFICHIYGLANLMIRILILILPFFLNETNKFDLYETNQRTSLFVA